MPSLHTALQHVTPVVESEARNHLCLVSVMSSVTVQQRKLWSDVRCYRDRGVKALFRSLWAHCKTLFRTWQGKSRIPCLAESNTLPSWGWS